MNQSRAIFFFAVLAIVVGIARCNSRKQQAANPAKPSAPPAAVAAQPAASAAPSAAPAESPKVAQKPAIDLKKLADKVTPAVVSLSTFDASGKLLRTGAGFFIGDDGKFVTSRTLLDGATNAIAKTPDGKFYNVSGILAEASAADVAMLRAELKEKVPFLTPNRLATTEEGTRLVVIGSPLNRGTSQAVEATAPARRPEATSDWLELPPSLHVESLGAPVTNEKGDILGVVAMQRGQGPAINVLRPAAAIDPLLAHVDAKTKPVWLVQAPTPPPPAEGPKKGPIPLAGTVPAGKSRLIFSPAPGYPAAARRAFYPQKGVGKYRVRFGANGEVRDVQVVQSTRSETLDSAAIETLRRWKAQPGQEWTANVPITFAP